MGHFPVAKRVETYIGVVGDGNGVIRIAETDKIIVELFERGSEAIAQAILDVDETVPAEGSIVWLVPDSDRAPNMLRVLVDLLP